MSRKQKVAVGVGLSVVVLLALFPIWHAAWTENGRARQSWTLAWVFSAPAHVRIVQRVGTLDAPPRPMPAGEANWLEAPYEHDAGRTTSFHLAALALTVAAVLVLSDRGGRRRPVALVTAERSCAGLETTESYPAPPTSGLTPLPGPTCRRALQAKERGSV